MVSPLLTVQLIDDETRKLILKNKYPLKNEFFYIYFPSDVRVSEEIYVPVTISTENVQQGI